MSQDGPTKVIIMFFWGVVITAVFYGVTLGQACWYFRRFPSDKQYMKALVVVLLVLGTAQFFFETVTIYSYLVRHRGNVAALNKVPRVFEMSMTATGILASIVELIYAVRIYQLSYQNKSLTGIIVLLALFGAGGGIAMVIGVIRTPFWNHTSKNNLPAGLTLASTVACDTIIAVVQVYLFHRYRMQNGFGNLHGMLKKLTRIIISIGVLTSIDAVVFLVTFLICPQNGFFIIPYLLLCNCYINSFLCLLNSRDELRGLADGDQHTNVTRSGTLHFNSAPMSVLSSKDETLA